MVLMTWEEFKKIVDSYLADDLRDGDIEIRYIDVDNPTLRNGLNVEFIKDTLDEEEQIKIT